LDGAAIEKTTVKLYMNEATADISQALLSALFNFYKPSRMMLRSSLENVMRVCVFLSGLETFAAKTTYALSTQFNSGELSTHPDTNKAVQAILSIYDRLCKYVHTSTPAHMDLRIPFSTIASLDDVDLLDCLNDISQVCSATNKLLFALRPKLLNQMHHKNADYIRDCLPPGLKRRILSA
jgi:hypothetical protein